MPDLRWRRADGGRVVSNISTGTARMLLGAGVLLATCAQLLFRIAMQRSGVTPDPAELQAAELLQSMSAGSIFLLCAGLVCYAASMVAWVPALSRIDVSVAYPVLASSYVLVYVFAIYLPWLHESPSPVKLAGIGIIMAGVVLVAASAPRIDPEKPR
jgi:undecaprenyl phosphate-alpha-L-ara4N flippase subunit ArnF